MVVESMLPADGVGPGLPPPCRSSLIPIRQGGSKRPIFFLPDMGGGVHYARFFMPHIDRDRPLFGFRPTTTPDCRVPASLEAMAVAFASDLLKSGLPGPYHLIGHSTGAYITFETARQLSALNVDIGVIALLDAEVPRHLQRHASVPAAIRQFVIDTRRWVARNTSARSAKVWKQRLGKVFRLATRPIVPHGMVIGRGVNRVYLSKLPESQRNLVLAIYDAKMKYQFRPFPGQLFVYRAQVRPFLQTTPPDMGWSQFAGAGVKIIEIPGNHDDMIHDDATVQLVARNFVENADRMENEQASAAAV